MNANCKILWLVVFFNQGVLVLSSKLKWIKDIDLYFKLLYEKSKSPQVLVSKFLVSITAREHIPVIIRAVAITKIKTKFVSVFSNTTAAKKGAIIDPTLLELVNSPRAVFLISGGKDSGVIQNCTAKKLFSKKK